jgi:hypothetical protein
MSETGLTLLCSKSHLRVSTNPDLRRKTGRNLYQTFHRKKHEAGWIHCLSGFETRSCNRLDISLSQLFH